MARRLEFDAPEIVGFDARRGFSTVTAQPLQGNRMNGSPYRRSRRPTTRSHREHTAGRVHQRGLPWEGSPFAWIKTRPSRQVGTIGEKLVAGGTSLKDFDVVKSPDSERRGTGSSLELGRRSSSPPFGSRGLQVPATAQSRTTRWQSVSALARSTRTAGRYPRLSSWSSGASTVVFSRSMEAPVAWTRPGSPWTCPASRRGSRNAAGDCARHSSCYSN